MLRRIHIHNFRSLVNFELKPDGLTFLFGPNGCGKTAIFEALRNVRLFIRLVDNKRTTEIFKWRDKTAWLNSSKQVFELDVDGDDGGIFSYRLVIAHGEPDSVAGLEEKSRIKEETLKWNGQPLLHFEDGKMQVYNERTHQEALLYQCNWHESGFTPIMERDDNKRIFQFRRLVDDFLFLRLAPGMMKSFAPTESRRLKYGGTNFPSWFRWLAQEDTDLSSKVCQDLAQIMPGLRTIKVPKTDELGRVLRVVFADKSGIKREYNFSQLSDGMKALFVNYFVLLTKGANKVLFLDEPDNYLTLREIQPWLHLLYDCCDDGEKQAFVASHHPMLMDIYQRQHIWLAREQEEHTRIVIPESDEMLKMSELYSRRLMEYKNES